MAAETGTKLRRPVVAQSALCGATLLGMKITNLSWYLAVMFVTHNRGGESAPEFLAAE
jgi:hypothetical protein